MNNFLLAFVVVSLNLTNIVNSLSLPSPSQACTDAKSALVASAECYQGYFNLLNASSDSPLCSGQCKILVKAVFKLCPNMVCKYKIHLYFIALFIYSVGMCSHVYIIINNDM